MKILSKVILVLHLIFINDFMLSFADNFSHEKSNDAVGGSYAVPFNSHQASALLSDAREQKADEVNQLRNRINQYRSPLSSEVTNPLSKAEKNKLEDSNIENPSATDSSNLTAGNAKNTGSSNQYINSKDQGIQTQDPNLHSDDIGNVMQKNKIEHARGTDNDKASSYLKQFNESKNTIQEKITQSFIKSIHESYDIEGVSTRFFSSPGIPGVLARQNLPSHDSQFESWTSMESSIESESRILALNRGELPGTEYTPSSTPLKPIEVDPESLSMDSSMLMSNLRNSNELVSPLTPVQEPQSPQQNLITPAPEMNDFCAQNPDNPNCIQQQNTTSSSSNMMIRNGKVDSQIKEIQSNPAAQNPSNGENPDQQKTISDQVINALRLELPLGSPDFYLPWISAWQKAKDSMLKFPKIDEPKVSLVVEEESIPKMMLRLSSNDESPEYFRKLLKGIEEKIQPKASTKEENPDFSQKPLANPPARVTSLKKAQLRPAPEFKIDYVAAQTIRENFTPFYRLDRFYSELLPFMTSNWPWIVWAVEEENRLIRSITSN